MFKKKRNQGYDLYIKGNGMIVVGKLTTPIEQATLKDLVHITRAKLNPATVIAQDDLSTTLIYDYKDGNRRMNGPFQITIDGKTTWLGLDDDKVILRND